jgi:hypothetical protein
MMRGETIGKYCTLTPSLKRFDSVTCECIRDDDSALFDDASSRAVSSTVTVETRSQV